MTAHPRWLIRPGRNLGYSERAGIVRRVKAFTTPPCQRLFQRAHIQHGRPIFASSAKGNLFMTTTLQEPAARVRAQEAAIGISVSGIVDIGDGSAFLRTSGYRCGPDDVIISAGQLRQYGLRKGDQIEGAARPDKRDGKFSPLIRVDTINGMPPDEARTRAHFADLTPLYPHERLRLEDGNSSATARIIDLVAPIGKGQRGLIVSPPKAGKPMVLQTIAAAIANSHPEVELMMGLVGERPDQATDLRRTVRGPGRPWAGSPPPPPTRRPPITWVRLNWPKSAPSAWWNWAATWWCCSTRSPGSAGPTTWRPRRTAGRWPAGSRPRR